MSEDRSATGARAVESEDMPYAGAGSDEAVSHRGGDPDEMVTYRGADPEDVGAAGRGGSTAVLDQTGLPSGAGAPAEADGRSAVSATRPGRRRSTRLALRRVDPWSVFVLSLLISMFLGVVLVVAVIVLYALFAALGVVGSIDSFARDLQIIDAGDSLLGPGRVLGLATLTAAIDVVVLTALSTLAAFLYNTCAGLTGGVEVVLGERD